MNGVAKIVIAWILLGLVGCVLEIAIPARKDVNSLHNKYFSRVLVLFG